MELLGRLIEVAPAAVRRLAGDANLLRDVGPRVPERPRFEHPLLQDLVGELHHLRCAPHRFKAVLWLLLSRQPTAQRLAQRRAGTDIASRVTVR